MPFDTRFEDIESSDLAILRDVAEGWYTEYKSELPSTRNVAKSISSFANQYGGWLFLGVEEDRETRRAGRFPGIEKRDIGAVEELIRNAAKDIVRPQIAYETRTFEGPVDAIGLSQHRCIVVVHVPEGANTPYIHNDGKIYVRVGDSSTPTDVTDRTTFDLLYQRGESRRLFLKQLVERRPIISEEEGDRAFIHLSILSDPYETLGHRYRGTYSDFAEVMSLSAMPFDNIYTSADGFIARQALANDRYLRLLTWEFSRNCHSFVTLPIETLPLQGSAGVIVNNVGDAWDPFSIGADVLSDLIEKGLEPSKVLNLNFLPTLLMGIVSKHHILVSQAGIKGPFYIKARIDNVWRAVPFLDINEYLDHVKKFDFPVIQDKELLAPSGTTLDTFVIVPELKNEPTEHSRSVPDGAVEIWMAIIRALGLPSELLGRNLRAVLDASDRETKKHRTRLETTR